MIIDKYLHDIEETIDSGDQKKAESLLLNIVSVFKQDIPDIEKGTSYLHAKMNMVLNMNDLSEPLSEEYDCISDLKLIKSKLEHYRDITEIKRPAPTVVNNTNVNISNSKVSNSNIASSVKNGPRRKAVIITVISVLAGIATIVGTVFAVLSYFHKL